MSEFMAFLQLGFGHIVAWDAADHILFLVALAAIYRGRDWRAALAVISAFTVGHSITLLLAVTDMLVLPSAIVEFLIPVTIVATGIENIVLRERAARGESSRHRPVFALIFGLVHGAGFAGYLRSLFMDDIAVPLLGFNVGIEIGQVIVLGASAAMLLLLDALLGRLRRTDGTRAFQLRVVVVSAVVAVVAGGWAVERLP